MVTATQAIGVAFDSDAIKILGTVLACMVIVVWLLVFGTMIRAIWLRRLLWPGKKTLAQRSEADTNKRMDHLQDSNTRSNGGAIV